MENLATGNRKILYIEAQRLFRMEKHGMDIVALELLQRLKNVHTDFDKCVLLKDDEDHCLTKNKKLKIQLLTRAIYPLWEQWILPRFTRLQTNSFLHCTGNTAPLWTSTPLLVTIHDLIFLEQNYLFKKDGGSVYQRFGNFYRSFVVPRAAKKATHVITVSEFQRQVIIKRLGIPPNKISVVYNGAHERFFIKQDDHSKKEIVLKYGIDGFDYIFFMANTDPRKNTDLVIKAFTQFCNQYPQFTHKLVIKGLTDEQLAKKIKAAGATGLEHRFHKVMYIAQDDLPAVYQCASMLWFPSLSEGFGLPIVEAMASGTPVITSNLSVMPEIAGHAALYIDPADPVQLVHQTLQLLTNVPFRNKIIERGHEQAKKFTWSRSLVQLLHVYDKVISKKTINRRTTVVVPLVEEF